MTNVADFWGAAHTTANTCYTTASTGEETCNGNGDSNILSADGGTTNSELFRFWQHLTNAGLLEGSFTGVAGSGGVLHSVPGQNIPSSRVNGAGFNMYYSSTISSHTNHYDMDAGSNFWYGGEIADNVTFSPVFTAEEAWNIDKKVDDGRPAFSDTRGHKPTFASVPNCTTSATGSAAEYKLTQSGSACSLIFITGY
jgi:hypothetical protein